MIAVVTGDTWDESADVVVVGAGLAGLSAALEARDGGADVLVLERYSGGGASSLSGGVVYGGGGTRYQRKAGVEDSPENMYAYLRTVVGDAVSEPTLRRFCEGSPAMIDWLAGHGVPFGSEVSPFKTSYPRDEYHLYFSGSESTGAAREVAEPAPRGHRARGKGTTGAQVTRPMESAAAWHGARFLRRTRVTDLVTDDEGRVVGVEALTMRDAPAAVLALYTRLTAASMYPGVYVPQLRDLVQKRLDALEARHARPIRVRADAGVVLAGGGFFANRAMAEQYAPAYVGGMPLGTAGDDGAVIRMGEAAGGATDRMGHISAWRFITPPSAMLGALFVGRSGRRHVDESRYGADIGYAMVENEGGVGWLLVDDALVARARGQLRTQAQWFQRIQAETLLRLGVRRADTLRDLAAAAGIDADELERTVAEHNTAIAEGRPDPMGKADEYRAPVATPPFRLLDVSVASPLKQVFDSNPCPMISLGGLVVDEESGQVLGADRAPVPGLYAAGRSAVGICSNGYVSGLALADCVFSGRRAGARASDLAASRTATPTA